MKKRALLVNDSKFESLILSDMLSKLDYDVEIADEFDAIYEVEQFSPDIIIVNYVMQETTGDELIHQIKLGQPTAKCVLSSSSSIKMSDFAGKRIDGILHTPVSMFSLNDILLRLSSSKDTENAEADKDENIAQRYCDGCSQDITIFGDNIGFCPYCGDELHLK